MGIATLVASTYSSPPQEFLQEAPHDTLAGADAVGVGAVEVEKAVVDGRLEDRPGVVRAERPVALMPAARLTEVHGAEAQFRHLDAGVGAELYRFQHGLLPVGAKS